MLIREGLVSTSGRTHYETVEHFSFLVKIHISLKKHIKFCKGNPSRGGSTVLVPPPEWVV